MEYCKGKIVGFLLKGEEAMYDSGVYDSEVSMKGYEDILNIKYQPFNVVSPASPSLSPPFSSLHPSIPPSLHPSIPPSL